MRTTAIVPILRDFLSDRPLSRLDLPPLKRRCGFLERAVPAYETPSFEAKRNPV
jgi:hypothetical protein